MKKILFILLLSLFFSARAQECDIHKGSGGLNRILLTIQPNTTNYFIWDFSGCSTSIHNFSIFLNKPRNKGFAAALPQNTPLIMTARDLVFPERDSDNFYFGPFSLFMGTVTHSKIQLEIYNTGKKSINVEVSFSAALGG